MMQEEQGFQCRFCKKLFSSGKSLGGHMRCHLALISAARGKERLRKKEEDDEGGGGSDDRRRIDDGPHRNSKNFSPVLSISSSSFSDGEDEGQERYGLRRKMVKSLGVSPNLVQSDDGVLRKLHRCKECSRKFPSARALSGHMRTHSSKLLRNQEQDEDGDGVEEHLCKTCGKGFDSVRALYGHMKSHSKRERFRSVSVDFDLVYPRKKRSAPRHRNGGLISEEVENAALGLMKLSKDTWKDCADKAEMKERDVENPEFTDTVSDDPENSVSEHMADCERDASKCCLTNTECGDSSPDAATAVVPMFTEASDQKDVEFSTPDASKCKGDDGDGSLKREYKCSSCKKIFPSHQALGGHRNRWRMVGSCPTNTECTDLSPESANAKLVISKDHECEICFKVFPTGQALGGHKRAHYSGNQELRCVQNNSLFGLNDDRQDGVGFKPWWNGNAALLT